MKGAFSHGVEASNCLIRDVPKWFWRRIHVLSFKSGGLSSPEHTNRSLQEGVLVNSSISAGERIGRSYRGYREWRAGHCSCWILSARIPPRMFRHDFGEESL